MYISLLRRFGLATVKKTPPRLALGAVRAVADEQTLEALIQNRFELMAGYAKGMRRAFNEEVVALKALRADASMIRAARNWLHRDAEKIPAAVAAQLGAGQDGGDARRTAPDVAEPLAHA